MQTYSKKRIEIIVEAPLVRRLTERLQRPEVHGYSVRRSSPAAATRAHGRRRTGERRRAHDGDRLRRRSAVVDAVVDDIFDPVAADRLRRDFGRPSSAATCSSGPPGRTRAGQEGLRPVLEPPAREISRRMDQDRKQERIVLIGLLALFSRWARCWRLSRSSAADWPAD